MKRLEHSIRFSMMMVVSAAGSITAAYAAPSIGAFKGSMFQLLRGSDEQVDGSIPLKTGARVVRFQESSGA